MIESGEQSVIPTSGFIVPGHQLLAALDGPAVESGR